MLTQASYLFAAFTTACLNPTASPEDVARLEQLFVENRAELITLAETAVQELEQSDGIQLKLPDSAFFRISHIIEVSVVSSEGTIASMILLN